MRWELVAQSQLHGYENDTDGGFLSSMRMHGMHAIRQVPKELLTPPASSSPPP